MKIITLSLGLYTMYFRFVHYVFLICIMIFFYNIGPLMILNIRLGSKHFVKYVTLEITLLVELPIKI